MIRISLGLGCVAQRSYFALLAKEKQYLMQAKEAIEKHTLDSVVK